MSTVKLSRFPRAMVSNAKLLSAAQLLSDSSATFEFLKTFFLKWLNIDVKSLAAALTVIGTILNNVDYVKQHAAKVWSWFVRLCTCSITIAADDKLNKEISSWLNTNVLKKRVTRVLYARAEKDRSNSWYDSDDEGVEEEIAEDSKEAEPSICYKANFGLTWFYYNRNIFILQEVAAQVEGKSNRRDRNRGRPITLVCLGRSPKPIKDLLGNCRSLISKRISTKVAVIAAKSTNDGAWWDWAQMRDSRPLSTIHLSETVKTDLVIDMKKYLSPKKRLFYVKRGIPYRRGYLLHGPPGTGKTSLTLALASSLKLDLYLLHLPSIPDDSCLAYLFSQLPPRCIVLLEDIDAIGASKQRSNASDEENEKEQDTSTDSKQQQGVAVTLSGLLNVLDGVASQEGRIILMTSNFADNLDKALIRPGRIDKMILLSYIDRENAKHMFLRIFQQDDSEVLDGTPRDEEKFQEQAVKFSEAVPEDKITPAQLQGFLINHCHDPELALKEIDKWVADQLAEVGKSKTAKVKAKEATKKTTEAEKSVPVTQVADFKPKTDESDLPTSSATSSTDENLGSKCCCSLQSIEAKDRDFPKETSESNKVDGGENELAKSEVIVDISDKPKLNSTNADNMTETVLKSDEVAASTDVQKVEARIAKVEATAIGKD